MMKWKQERPRVVIGKTLSFKQIFLKIYFLHDDCKGFLDDVELRLIDKTQGSDSTRREYSWIRTLKTLYPNGLSIICYK